MIISGPQEQDTVSNCETANLFGSISVRCRLGKDREALHDAIMDFGQNLLDRIREYGYSLRPWKYSR
jgi:hypothetical protein